MRLVKIKEGVYVNPAFVVSVTRKSSITGYNMHPGSVVLLMGGVALEMPGSPDETAQVLEIPPSTPTPLDIEKKKEEPKEEPKPRTTVVPIVGSIGSKGMGSASFLLFWAEYPKKVGKGDVERIWKRLKPDAVLLNRILQAIREQERSKQWKDGFIPNPATWLNQKRWLDEVAEPAKALSESVKGAFT